MSRADRHNDYSFNEFLGSISALDYYKSDIFFQAVVRKYTADEWETVNEALQCLSHKVSGPWRKISQTIAVPEKSPQLIHYDAYNNRLDRIIRPAELLSMEREVFAEALFSPETSPWMKLSKMFLIYQNGEGCISCPLTCTEGLVAILEQFDDSEETRKILDHCRIGIDDNFAIGSQYISEIQGGSDVSENRVEAEFDGKNWRLFGKKFFCSAAHADYAVVTAKPSNSEKIALFVVPKWHADFFREKRQGYTIDRLKWKMGTVELPTAEITFDGALAYPVGPLEKGLSLVVGTVLTYSRLTVALSAAAIMTRAAREANLYCRFRSAFGEKLEQFPMVQGQLRDLTLSARRTTAGAFKLYQKFIEVKQGKELVSEQFRLKKFMVREMIMLQKITTAWDCTDAVRNAISLFGGHGVTEDFSDLPRLYRDSVVNELWEGPRNVLLWQIYRDLKEASTLYAPDKFVSNMLEGAEKDKVAEISKKVTDILSRCSFTDLNEENIYLCRQWDQVCADMWHAFQDVALQEVDV